MAINIHHGNNFQECDYHQSYAKTKSNYSYYLERQIENSFIFIILTSCTGISICKNKYELELVLIMEGYENRV